MWARRLSKFSRYLTHPITFSRPATVLTASRGGTLPIAHVHSFFKRPRASPGLQVLSASSAPGIFGVSLKHLLSSSHTPFPA
jgi:hypothetical protein